MNNDKALKKKLITDHSKYKYINTWENIKTYTPIMEGNN